MDFVILPARQMNSLLEGCQFVSFLIRPLSGSAYIWSYSGRVNHSLRHGHRHLQYHLAPLPNDIQMSSDEASLSSSPRELSWVSGYIHLNHKTFIIIFLVRKWEKDAFALHQPPPECSTLVCQGGQKHKRKLKLSRPADFRSAFMKRESHIPSPQTGRTQPQSALLSNTLFLPYFPSICKISCIFTERVSWKAVNVTVY